MALNRIKLLKIGLHILLGALVGLFIAAAYLSKSAVFRHYIQEQIEVGCLSSYQCRVRLSVDSIDWIGCSATLKNVDISPLADLSEKPWSIFIDRVDIKGSWLRFVFTGKLQLRTDCKQMALSLNIASGLDDFMKFLSKIFSNFKPVFFVSDAINISDSFLFLHDDQNHIAATIPFHCGMEIMEEGMKVQAYLTSGSIKYKDQELLQNIKGILAYDFKSLNPLATTSGKVDINYQFSSDNNPATGFLSGKMTDGKGSFVLKTEDGSIVVDPIMLMLDQSVMQLNLVSNISSQLLSHVAIPDIMKNFVGAARLSISCDVYNILQTIQASLIFDDVKYQSKTILQDVALSVTSLSNNGLQAMLSVKKNKIFNLMLQKDGEISTIHLNNVADLCIPFLPKHVIHADRCLVSLSINADDTISGSYECILVDDHQQETKIIGQVTYAYDQINIFGFYDDKNFHIKFQVDPEFAFKAFWLKQQDHLLIDVEAQAQTPLSFAGSCDFSAIKLIAPEEWKSSFMQEGSFVFNGSYDQTLNVFIQSSYAHIRIPWIYNVVQHFSASIALDIHQKLLTLSDLSIQLYQGNINCSLAKLYFDQADILHFIHAPCLFENVLIKFNQSVHAVVSGNLLLLKKITDPHPTIFGNIVTQQSNISENIFSLQLIDLCNVKNINQKKVPLALDLTICSKEPLKVQTPFLNVNSFINVGVNGMVDNPSISGSLQLESGAFKFPFKPLDIVSGNIVFFPDSNQFDPMVNFLAKGKIKQYQIVLKAWGTVQNPHIALEAEPYLSQEQIVALLLLGVQDQSLSVMLPAFLAQRITDLVFGPTGTHYRLKTFFDLFLQSLKYVRFMPQFSNISGRGGVRGIFEIDATDHLQAKIDTNFTHLEDTKFDIDYAATDDVTLRLEKDGPSTYGGQVEFRWKFS